MIHTFFSCFYSLETTSFLVHSGEKRTQKNDFEIPGKKKRTPCFRIGLEFFFSHLTGSLEGLQSGTKK